MEVKEISGLHAMVECDGDESFKMVYGLLIGAIKKFGPLGLTSEQLDEAVATNPDSLSINYDKETTLWTAALKVKQ